MDWARAKKEFSHELSSQLWLSQRQTQFQQTLGVRAANEFRQLLAIRMIADFFDQQLLERFNEHTCEGERLIENRRRIFDAEALEAALIVEEVKHVGVVVAAALRRPLMANLDSELAGDLTAAAVGHIKCSKVLRTKVVGSGVQHAV